MKLVRYGSDGREKPGLIDGEGRLRDLSVAIETIDQGTLSPQGLNSLRSIAPESLPRVKGSPTLAGWHRPSASARCTAVTSARVSV